MGMKKHIMMAMAMGSMFGMDMGGMGTGIIDKPREKGLPHPKSLPSIEERKLSFFKALEAQNKRCENQHSFHIVDDLWVKATTKKRAIGKVNSLLRQYHLKPEDFVNSETLKPNTI